MVWFNALEIFPTVNVSLVLILQLVNFTFIPMVKKVEELLVGVVILDIRFTLSSCINVLGFVGTLLWVMNRPIVVLCSWFSFVFETFNSFFFHFLSKKKKRKKRKEKKKRMFQLSLINKTSSFLNMISYLLSPKRKHYFICISNFH